ncbi:unnamed protein product, partial [Discosporangium mesarthrocarpum]
YLVLTGGASLSSKNKRGWTPLMQAVVQGDTPMYRFLVDRGAGVNDSNAEGETVLDLARKCLRPQLLTYISSKGGFASEDVLCQIEEVKRGNRGLFRLW